MNRRPTLYTALLTLALVTACSGPIQRKDGNNSVRNFSFKGLVKGDVDDVIEIHQKEVIGILKTLTLKLYRRNPNEWRKSGFTSADEATRDVFKQIPLWTLSAQKDLNWETILRDLWREDFTGDRVKALMNGLLVMHMAAFNNSTEFYLLTEMDAQKLYNAARNTEAIVWKLSNAKTPRGDLILLSNGFDAQGVANLSFEREFGMLIGIQDALAKVIENKNNRTIRFGVVNLASMVFLPI